MEGGRETMQNPMQKQEEEVLQRREQAMEALIRHLPRLSTERCPCPSVNLARASFNRVQVIKALWPEYGADAKAMEALVVVLSCYTLAIWWCQHTLSVATTLIQQYVGILLECRQVAENRNGAGS
jgi:hypothetical protein